MKSAQLGFDENSLLAFCHIEKAAGTSLIHILRRIFFLRYAAVRPMLSHDNDTFTDRDLKVMMRINPFLRGFGGHAVVPYGNLLDAPYRIEFITQLRDPVKRAISQFKFWNSRMSLDTNWQDYLNHPVSRNFQVKKLAGCEDLELAIRNLSNHFMLAGTVERFETFVVLLANKLGLPLFLFTYQKQNIARDATVVLPELFFEELRDRNQLDQQLYDWIDDELIPRYIADYQGDFSADLREFRRLQESPSLSTGRFRIDFLYRNIYLKPVSGFIRLIHGLPWQGSYARR